jgi:hypothetical protein
MAVALTAEVVSGTTVEGLSETGSTFGISTVLKTF